MKETVLPSRKLTDVMQVLVNGNHNNFLPYMATNYINYPNI